MIAVVTIIIIIIITAQHRKCENMWWRAWCVLVQGYLRSPWT
jgi:hypothetical protein